MNGKDAKRLEKELATNKLQFDRFDAFVNSGSSQYETWGKLRKAGELPAKPEKEPWSHGVKLRSSKHNRRRLSYEEEEDPKQDSGLFNLDDLLADGDHASRFSGSANEVRAELQWAHNEVSLRNAGEGPINPEKEAWSHGVQLRQSKDRRRFSYEMDEEPKDEKSIVGAANIKIIV